MTNIDDKILVMCAWCGKIKIDDKWEDNNFPNYKSILESYKDKISHGCCEKCESGLSEKYGLSSR